MLKRTLSRIFVFSILCTFMNVSSIMANLITIEITSTITSIDDDGNILGGAIEVGDLLTGSYTYESTTPDNNPLAEVGDYRHTASPCGISISSGDFVFQTDPGNVDFLVELCNDHGNTSFKHDAYLLRSYNNLSLSNGVEVEHIAWQLYDENAAALTSTALPFEPPVLSDWPDVYGIEITGGVRDPEYPYMGYDQTFTLWANVTYAVLSTPTAVPEPSPVFLFLSGFLGVFCVSIWKRRNHSSRRIRA